MTSEEVIIEKFCEEHEGLLKSFEKWISTQSQIPQNMEKIVLIRYLKVCDNNLEKAKDLLELNLDYRVNYSHIFTNRDIRSKELQKIASTVQVCTLPNLTKDKLRVTIFRLIDSDSRNFNFNDAVKYIFMAQDMMHISINDGVIAEGESCIFDAKDFSIWHFLKLGSAISTVRLFMRYVQEAVPHHLSQNHFVNCSPILTKIIALIRPLMNKELCDTMHFHTTGLETLYEFVPKEFLPTEYGGSLGSLEEFYDKSLEAMDSKRDYLRDDDNWGFKQIME